MNIFWSYARRDDLPPGRRIWRLRGAFRDALSQVLGEDCEVYFDRIALNWGVQWRREIVRLIGECDGFVAIITPSYFNSKMCIYELQTAVEADRRILPIHYRNCIHLRSTFKENAEDPIEAEINRELNITSLRISELHMKDFRELRNRPLDSQEVQDFLDSLAEGIA